MILYMIARCTWGFIQSTVGFIVFLLNIRARHFIYHGAIITEWKYKSSVSLGLFIFVTKEPNFYWKFRDKYTMEEVKERLLVHEYGHAIQSLILGPLYMLIISLPSGLWAGLPPLYRMRHRRQLSYYWFYPECWANFLGEKVTKTKSMERMVID